MPGRAKLLCPRNIYRWRFLSSRWPKESVTSIANAGNLYAAVLRFVLAVQMDDNTRQPLDDVSVGCRTTVKRPRPDAENNLHDFLFRLFVIPADENIAQWRINFA